MKFSTRRSPFVFILCIKKNFKAALITTRSKSNVATCLIQKESLNLLRFIRGKNYICILFSISRTIKLRNIRIGAS